MVWERFGVVGVILLFRAIWDQGGGFFFGLLIGVMAAVGYRTLTARFSVESLFWWA